jgi:NhaP-type Na+/H+ or K+/H+ antiporter
LSAFILKRFRIFSKNPVTEVMMIFCMGYLAYVTAELSKNSGIITLLTVGIVMGHYTWFNLSPMGKQASYMVFEFLGYTMEAFVFGYLGLTFFSYAQSEFSISFFLVELFVIMVGRLCGTLGLISMIRLCGYDAQLNVREIIFIWYAGMIRGAIAFGLVLRIHSGSQNNRQVIVTTALMLVVFTTVFMGSTVGILQKCLFKNMPKKVRDDEVD